MSLPTFCKVCRNLTGVIDVMNGSTTCPVCGTVEKLANRVISEEHHNTGNRMITDIEIRRLTTEPTTQKILKKCESCDNNIMAQIFDDSFIKVTTSCGKCGAIYGKK